MLEVKSSTISHIGYDQETQELTIRFAKGGEYTYPAVPVEEFAALVCADSIGKHFQTNIRPKYVGVKQPSLVKQTEPS